MNLIAEKRKEAGISQAGLAQKLGWSQSRIANYETCTRTPSLSASRLIVSALNDMGLDCTLDAVFPPIAA